ncbi:MAG: hypothetical protein ABW032_01785 [Burkholderiaceae bacterium]
MSDWMGWIETILGTTVLAVAFIATYEGARRIARGGLSRWPSAMLALGLLLPVYEAGASLKIPARVRLQAVEQQAMRASEPPGGWEKAPMSAEQRTRLSANAAMINYMVSGLRQPFIDPDGRRVPYTPTPQESQAREALVRDQKGAEDTGAQFFERGVRLFVTALVSMLAGLAVGGLQRRRRTVDSRAGAR